MQKDERMYIWNTKKTGIKIWWSTRFTQEVLKMATMMESVIWREWLRSWIIWRSLASMQYGCLLSMLLRMWITVTIFLITSRSWKNSELWKTGMLSATVRMNEVSPLSWIWFWTILQININGSGNQRNPAIILTVITISGVILHRTEAHPTAGCPYLAEVPGNMFLNVDNTISISLLKNNRIWTGIIRKLKRKFLILSVSGMRKVLTDIALMPSVILTKDWTDVQIWMNPLVL